MTGESYFLSLFRRNVIHVKFFIVTPANYRYLKIKCEVHNNLKPKMQVKNRDLETYFVCISYKFCIFNSHASDE
jgi:hypothetical protein